MEKEEILQKAQNRRANVDDERELQILQKGNGVSIFCILLIATFLMIMKIFAKHPWYDVYAIAFVSIGVPHLYKGIKLHCFREICIGMAYIILAAVAVVYYLTQIMGK